MDTLNTDQVDVLLLAAHGPDLRGLGSALGEQFHGFVGGLRVAAKSVGVGPVAAAASTSKRVFALRPRAVVHLGSASGYSLADGFQPNTLLVPNRIVFSDHGVVAGQSRFPEPMVSEAEASLPLVSGLLQVAGAQTREGSVASPASTTETVDMAAKIRAATGAIAENLEAFGIRYACGLAETPYAAVLSLTDIVGPDQAHHRAQFERPATFATARVVLDWLASGAHGLTHQISR